MAFFDTVHQWRKRDLLLTLRARWRDTGLALIDKRSVGSLNGVALNPRAMFDLVYVFAVTQLSHHLLGHATTEGACRPPCC